MSSMLSAPGGHPGDQARDLQVRVDPALAARPDVLRDQVRPGRRAAPGPSPGPGRRATRDSGRRTMRASSPGYATIALTRCPLEPGDWKRQNSHCPSSEGTFHVDTPETPLFDRWIEAKVAFPQPGGHPRRQIEVAIRGRGQGLSRMTAIARIYLCRPWDGFAHRAVLDGRLVTRLQPVPSCSRGAACLIRLT